MDLSNEINNCRCTYEYKTGVLPMDFDTVKIGSYPQSDITGKKKEPIEWFVLNKKKEKGKALLISKYILDCHEYNDIRKYDKGRYEYLLWKNTTLREFLNNEFYNEAFSNEEKGLMMKMIYEGESDNITDYVSCLSLSELDKYFDFWREGDKFIENRVSCKPTPYAVSKGLHVNEFSGCSGYNYRLPQDDYGLDGWTIWAMHFYNGGYTIEESMEQYKHMYDGVRPVICVKY